jgi:hypothetical protein
VEENWLKYSKMGDTLWVAVFRGRGGRKLVGQALKVPGS